MGVDQDYGDLHGSETASGSGLLVAALRQIITALEADYVSIYAVSGGLSLASLEEQRTLAFVAGVDARAPVGARSADSVLGPDLWPLDRLSKGEVVSIPSTGLQDRAKARSALLVPLIREDALVGVLSVEGATVTDAESGPLVGVLAAAGSLAAGLLEAQEAEATLEAGYTALMQRLQARSRAAESQSLVAEGLRDILIVLNSDQTLESILEYLVAQAQVLLGPAACVLYRTDPDQAQVLIEAEAGLPDDFPSVPELPLGADGQLDEGVLSQLVLSDVPVVRTDLRSPVVWEALSDPALPKPTQTWFQALADRYATLLSVPLVVKQTTYGSLGLYYTTTETLSDEDVALATSFGSQAALAIENAQLRIHAEQAAVLQERGRLARDLHDSVTQSLYSLTLLAEAARRLADAGHLSEVEDAIGRLGEIGQQALQEMRLLVYELRPLVLRREGLVRALSQRLETVERRAGLEAQLMVDGALNLAPALEEQLYHVIQEALNNALKHAHATAVTVRIRVLDEELWVEVRDNGIGFDPERVRSEGGIGLTSMRERVEKLGGALAIRSSLEEGTQIIVSLRSVQEGTTPRERNPNGG